MGADREHEPIGEPGGLAHEVEMAVGDGIERSRKKRGPRHGGGLARALGSRKVARTVIRGGGRRRASAIGVATAEVKQFAKCCCPSDSCAFSSNRNMSRFPRSSPKRYRHDLAPGHYRPRPAYRWYGDARYWVSDSSR